MKKFICICSFMIICNAHAINWWEQSTVCRLDPTKCYSSMGTGYDPEYWDATSSCRGVKMICPDALIDQSFTDPQAMGRAEIAAGKLINSDFDVTVLNGDCFGSRKTMANGTQAIVNGTNVNVWCPGILDSNNIEQVASGEILTSGTQPTCQSLANDGYIAVVNNRCYGKYFSDSEYFIDCGANAKLIPERIIILNGADYTTRTSNAPASQSDANAIFDSMYNVSQAQRAEKFKLEIQ
ncbi:MAG: hypothetical protein NC311_06025 [Muribaculaceae bacterium]|nr:hypothetical protein [Muribaculaceae bacterium]